MPFPFDEAEAVFAEDIDLSWRSACCYRVILVPKSIIYYRKTLR
jgi:hypothetical protein